MSIELINLWERVQVVYLCVGFEDQWVWVSGRQGGFSIESVWEVFCPCNVWAHWVGLLWGGRNIPRHFFCAWLAIKDRLGNRDRLHRWDSSISLCILCERGSESRHHLFFRVLLDVIFSSMSFKSWLPLTGLGGGMFSCFWFVVSVLGRVWKESCGVCLGVLRSILSGMIIVVVSMMVKLMSLMFCFKLFKHVFVLVLCLRVRISRILFSFLSFWFSTCLSLGCRKVFFCVVSFPRFVGLFLFFFSNYVPFCAFVVLSMFLSLRLL